MSDVIASYKYTILPFLACVYAFFSITIPDVASIALIFLVVLLIFDKRYVLVAIKKDHFLKLILAAVIFPILTWGWASINDFPWQADYPRRVESLLKLFSFLIISYVLLGKLILILCFLISFFLGLLVSPFITGDGFTEIGLLLSGRRIDFGIKNAQHIGILSAALIILCVVFIPRLISYHGKNRRLFAIILFSITVLCSLMLYGSQTRAAWVGLISCLIVASITQFLRMPDLKIKVGIVLAAIMILALTITIDNPFVKRFKSEASTFASLTSGDISTVPLSSVGIRIHLWVSSYNSFQESMVVGKGEHEARVVVEGTPYLSDYWKNTFSHLHNSYIEILVKYGLVGLVWYITLLAVLFLTIRKQYKRGLMDISIYQSFKFFMIFWIVINLFESYVFFYTGTTLFGVIAAAAYTYRQREGGIKDIS